ncbi:hypothetical protein ACH5RR_019533 [Cinchona calisaya]|uniref:BP28 C-terminal domain-containing protein n=1 Tax=Cinchona calisaya TaxID=153742 RepID=A0ABD2ZPM8_9GENT
MATSIASQLQALKSVVKADTEPLKKPFTRPSILFNLKDAADIDVDAIFGLALSGLEALISKEERFRNYKNDLFSHKSRELDRELMGIEENNRINATISSYLRLLSGYFELLAARRTLEYLIRRYKIHVYNTEELILCALPYHDTHEFVRVVQLINTGNSRWKFLDGVKASGAPPPRKVIVQQCIRDLGVLEVICNYATPSKKIQPMRTVTSFCTAVVIEVLGSMSTVSSDVVKRILPYVVSGLQPHARGKLEQKAGALMIVGLLAQKVALAPNLVRSLIRSVVDVAQEDAKQSNDPQWFRMSLMALISLVQLQHVELIPRKIMDVLMEIRDISEVLGGLTEEFKIDKFLTVFLDSLLEYSSADQNYHRTLMSIIETVPLKFYVDSLVSKLLKICMRISKNRDQSYASESVGSQPKEILVSLYKKYPVDLRRAVQKILQDTEVQSGNEKSSHELLSKILDGEGNFSLQLPGSKFWFALEHPKAEVRRSALMGLDVVGIMKDKAIDLKTFEIFQDAIVRRLQDDDLTVIQAVLNVQGLNQMISPSVLLDRIQCVLDRCIQILFSGASNKTCIAGDVAVSCLQLAITSFKDQDEYIKTLATMIFPLVLILPKTQRVNLKALELAKEVKWPFYGNLISLSTSEKKLGFECISSTNLENISKLAEDFRMHHEELMPWLLECSNRLQLSKILFFLILLQSFVVPKLEFVQFSVLYDAMSPILQREWEMLESAGNVSYAEESNLRMPDGDCRIFIERLFDNSFNRLNSEVLICIFWRLVEAFIMTAPDNGKPEMWLCKLQNLYIFFASQSSQLFKKHLHYLVTKCKSSLSEFLSKMFSEEGVSSRVQAESLHSFVHLCSQSDENLAIQLLAEFPSVLVPLASKDQDVRMAAISCIEGLFTMWSRVNLSRPKNGNTAVWIHFLGDFLGLMVQQKRLILSDQNVLPSIIKSLLSSSTDSLLVQQSIGKRFDPSTKDDLLVFLLGSAQRLSAYAKLKILSLLKGLGIKVTEVTGVKSLMYDLLERRHQYHILHNKSSQKLSKTDVEILCLLLEICTMPTPSVDRHRFDDLILVKALEINGSTYEDPAVVEPCITLLKNLRSSVYGSLKAETQEILVKYLVILFRNGNAEVQSCSREALLQINISNLVVSKLLDSVVDSINGSGGSALGKKKKKWVTHQISDVFQQGENAVSFLCSLLDVLILKKNIESRSSLIGSLIKLLHLIFMNNEWVHGTEDEANKYLEASTGVSQTVSSTRVYIQQTLLLILEDIASSAINNCPEQDDFANMFDLELLVKCARLASDAVTRNHALSLFSAVAKVIPDKVLDHILDILNVIGESAVIQWDSHSQRVFEDLISAVVPFWLSQTGDMEKLLQIFVDVLPQVSQHQRLSIIVYLLRNLGESRSFGSFLFLLFHSLVSREGLLCFDDGEPTMDALTSIINTRWQYLFARQLSAQYSCMIWLSSLVSLLQRIGMGPWDEKHYMQLIVAVQFVLEKLQDPEIFFMLDSGEDIYSIQITLGALMEQIVYLLNPVNARKKHIVVSSVIKNGIKEKSRIVLKTIAKGLVPVSYFKVIIQLLRHADENVRKKALGLLSQTVKESGTLNKIQERRQSRRSLRNSWLHFDETDQKSFDEMCIEILKLVDDSDGDSGGASLKLAAVSTLEVLAQRYPSDNPIFGMCLKSVCKNICSNNSAVSSSCLRATSALIHVLGPRALSELPRIMECMFNRSRDISLSIAEETKSYDVNFSMVLRNLKDSVFLSVLVTLEAVVDKLGGFLNPYLGNILELLVLHPWYTSAADVKLKLRAEVVRKLVTDKIPVRLLLPPLLRIYADAIISGGSSVSVVFEMLGNMVNTMDRSAVTAYHVQIFDLGLLALDLRCQHPDSIKDIHVVEEKVINSIVCLTMKLTETMFKPLFVKSIEWSGSYMEESKGSKTIDRAIAFYSLVNKLAESHRSLFVPYFKYLLDGCVHHLSEDTQVTLTRKKKKVKIQVAADEKNDSGNEFSVGLWHLRALILLSLHKCFLYDTGSLKFLDSSNFQVLLKPIVSQLAKDPPSSLEQHPDVPSMKEVDDLLVSCVGQMAVAAGSDLLWKPLNHEVLMQTRSEKVRSRILGLRIVKYLVENLKEEYLVLLPETIPFLGELLEDVELPVKTLAQEILKEMEFMSGESLRQYL